METMAEGIAPVPALFTLKLSAKGHDDDDDDDDATSPRGGSTRLAAVCR